WTYLVGLIAASIVTACGNTAVSNRTSQKSSSSDAAGAEVQKPTLTVEDVVAGFELGEKLPVQEATEEDKALWEKSLVMDDKLRSPDAIEGGLEFLLDEVTPDQREVVDLRPNDTGVRNQGSEGTCTAFATVATMENLVKRFYGQSVDISERHHWSTYADYQSTSSLSKAKAAPIVSESSWPYYGRKPSSFQGLGIAKLNSYTTTKLSLLPVVESLRKGQPVVIAVGVLTSLMNPRQGGIIQGGAQKGGAGHAIAVTGAIIDSRVPGGGYFIIKNSWGGNWGDKGYGYVAFDYCQRTWCSAYSIADASVFKDGQLVPKPSIDPSPTTPPAPTPTPVSPPAVDPAPAYTAADFKLTGHPSHRRGIFGMTSFYLTVEAKPEIMKQIRSVQYAESRGSFYTVNNGSSADIAVSVSNMASPDFRTRANSFQTEPVVIKLRNGKKLILESIKVNL
ncbi:MAG: C1 family peptidase, partial [Proteobacteria bacterium]|nr:C1 family peptidase [Pseudomonadota bacterium]